MAYTIRVLAADIGAEVMGDADLEIIGLASLSSAQSGQLAYCDNKHLPQRCMATALIVPQNFDDSFNGVRLIVDAPKRAFVKLLHLFYPEDRPASGIDPSASVSAAAYVDPSAYIGAHVVIMPGVRIGARCVIEAGSVLKEGVTVGDDTRLYPRVTVYDRVSVGKNCTIHSGVVIGGDGFGYLPDATGCWQKIPQVGAVRIDDAVEIGPNTTIDRGALDDTVIETGVKIDNLCMIAHNVKIGAHTVIAGSTAIAGSATIGAHCIIGGATAINGHIQIADHVHFAGRSMVTKSINKAGVYASGTGIMPQKQWQRCVVRFRQLEDWYQRFTSIEKKGV